MKKVIDATEEVKGLYSVSGFLYIVAGISAGLGIMIDSTLFLILQMICVTGTLIIITKIAKAEKRISDEMSEKNLLEAKALTFDVIKIFLLFCLSVLYIIDVLDIEIMLSGKVESLFLPVIFLLIGISSMAVGYLFKKYEEE